ncbi:MAG TPA: CPBP family intramembrane glutamic endopeptidase [Pirellulales bacterium]|nr:CPBP family intramembrane glutamic endopeptidase [Pirellulales bacterium]
MTDEEFIRNDQSPNIVRLALFFEGGLAMVACAAGLLMKTPPWQHFFWQPLDIARGLAATLPLVVGLLLLRRAHRGALGKLNAVVDETLVAMFTQCSVAQLAMVSLVAGIGEELLFRGVLQPVFIGWWGTAVGLSAASAIFGLLHALTAAYAVLATVVGAYLGWLALATGNLLVPITTHAMYDFVALVYLIRTPPATCRRIS